ncbi:beta-ketoacyl synthase N-terminal-like domain-containing protein [Streptomyces buecherae]|uniref:beta-ketoacyl synthase N-terminal-like domain-containing protein n=1 Tax=Streptomyces buecherae TaxID=2763006 RepID=UPI001C280C05|nr:beta-ketoacyl synthase N-terminal-like domain-containing protein [Streptomyces buecherae]
MPTQDTTRTSPVPVTGVGVVSAAGTSVAALYEALLAGARPVTVRDVPLVAGAIPAGPNRRPDQDSAHAVEAAHVTAPLTLPPHIDARARRTIGRDTGLLLSAAQAALTSTPAATATPVAPVTPAAEPDQAPPATSSRAGAAEPVPASSPPPAPPVPLRGADPARIGVFAGTLHAGRSEYVAIHNRAGADAGPVNPVWGPQSSYNAPGAALSIHLGLRGPNLTLTSGAAVGLDAIALGVQHVRTGRCDAVIAGGVDSLSAACPPPAAGGAAADATAASGLAEAPAGEGAAVVVLTAPDGPAHAPAVAHVCATARAYAAGGGAAGEPSGGRADTGPANTGAGAGAGAGAVPDLAEAGAEAARAALRDAGRAAHEVAVAVTTADPHTPTGAAERAAIAAVFGPALPHLTAAGTTGTTGGADGALAFALAVEALTRTTPPPPTPPDPNAGTDLNPNSAAPLALCLGLDPDGAATALLLSGPTPTPTSIPTTTPTGATR